MLSKDIVRSSTSITVARRTSEGLTTGVEPLAAGAAMAAWLMVGESRFTYEKFVIVCCFLSSVTSKSSGLRLVMWFPFESVTSASTCTIEVVTRNTVSAGAGATGCCPGANMENRSNARAIRIVLGT